MNNKEKSCGCESNIKLIFPCSGAADVGEISDRASRELTRTGIAKMFCLTGIGGNISGMIASAKAADQVLVIDGCGSDCAKKTLEEKGLGNFLHLRVTDLGMKKSESPPTQGRIMDIFNEAKRMISSDMT